MKSIAFKTAAFSLVVLLFSFSGSTTSDNLTWVSDFESAKQLQPLQTK